MGEIIMANNPQTAKKLRKELTAQIDAFFAQGNEVKQLGFQMTNKPLPLVIDGKKEYTRQKLKPSFTREGIEG